MTYVAVIGTANSGKTMLLTSLLWNLEEFDKSRFRLQDGVEIRRFRRRAPPKGTNAFEYHKYRNQIAHKFEWPSKTVDASQFHCSFERSDRISMLNRQDVVFLDIPGERLADAAMVTRPDYADWCDDTLNLLATDSAGTEIVREYNRNLEPSPITQDTATRAYRRVLARLITEYKPYVSPSVFLLDSRGNPAENTTVQELTDNRHSGLDAQSEFAALPAEVRNRNPDLTARMARHYREYRDTVTLPLFRSIIDSDTWIIVSDIPAMLMAGDRRFSDERQLTLALFQGLTDQNFGAWLLKLFWLRPSLSRVAFVATKADLVARDDLSNGRLGNLLREMHTRAARNLPSSVEHHWFTCSSCNSTQPGAKPYTVVGQVNPGTFVSERRTEEYSVSALPEHWPASFDGRDYHFQSFWPRVPENLMIPPRHTNLDRLFDFAVLGKNP